VLLRRPDSVVCDDAGSPHPPPTPARAAALQQGRASELHELRERFLSDLRFADGAVAAEAAEAEAPAGGVPASCALDDHFGASQCISRPLCWLGGGGLASRAREIEAAHAARCAGEAEAACSRYREALAAMQARLLAELTRLSADSRQAAALDVAALVARGGD